MNDNSKTFQTVLLGAFGFFAVLGVLIFSGIIPILQPKKDVEKEFLGTVTLWGTIPARTMDGVIDDHFGVTGVNTVKVVYVEKNKNSFDKELIEALASKKGPDAILLSEDLITRYEDKIFAIPYESLSLRQFQDTYIEEAELYLTDKGILALPLVVDPLILYWNRDLFASEAIAAPPAYWEDLNTIVPRLTYIDPFSKTIVKSAISFGDYRNVTNAKDILVMLMLQAGNTIVKRESDGMAASLGDSSDGLSPADSALRFFLGFSNQADTQLYTWNRALPHSQDMFLAGDLAMYIGYTSEFADIEKKNPHLNFDVAQIPQRGNANAQEKKVTFGKMYGVAILNDTKNFPAAFKAITTIADTGFASQLADSMGIPPVRKALLAKIPSNEAYLPIFYKSALISKSWLDPNPIETDDIFKNMVEDVLSQRRNISGAVDVANRLIEDLLP